MQSTLFIDNALVTNVITEVDMPEVVSFRELVPEITSTTYLTHNLYYYPAKFIPQVVKYCLDQYTQKNDWVIDPFAGSGTVGLEANLQERNAVLWDLNLLLDHIIPIKIRQDKTKLEYTKMQEKLDALWESQEAFKPAWSNLAYWYPAEILEVLQILWGGQKALEQDVYAQILQAALVKVSKEFSYAEHKTPKLFKSKTKKIYMENLLQKDWKNELKNTLQKMVFDMLLGINQYTKRTLENTNEVLFYGGIDSSSFETPQDITIDCLISSPPYLQAQEYIRTVKLDLYWLGYSEADIKRISKLEIPYRKATRVIETPTLLLVKQQLEREDLSKMLDSYFCHTINALENATKHLKTGGKACIFVGNPKVDGIEVETWRILWEYFIERGFTLHKIFEDRIKSRQLFKARKNKNPDGMKSEYLLVLEKN